jgi:hypothetical protein
MRGPHIKTSKRNNAGEVAVFINGSLMLYYAVHNGVFGGIFCVHLQGGSKVQLYWPVLKADSRSHSEFWCLYTKIRGTLPVAQLVEVLRYNYVGRGFNSRLCHWNSSLT